MIENLRQKLKMLALADAIIEPEWDYRYFSYDSKWSATEEMGSLRDGSGGEWFLWLSGHLAAYKCVSPDDGLMPDIENLKKDIPSEYLPFLNEEAFSMNESTCIWYWDGTKWNKNGLEVKYLIDLEKVTNWTSKDYHAWAIEYYEIELDLSDVDKLFKDGFSREIALKLNPNIDFSELESELEKIGINS